MISGPALQRPIGVYTKMLGHMQMYTQCVPGSCSSVLGTVAFKRPPSPYGQGIWLQTRRSRVPLARALAFWEGWIQTWWSLQWFKNPIWAFCISSMSIKPSALLTHLFLFWLLPASFRDTERIYREMQETQKPPECGEQVCQGTVEVHTNFVISSPRPNMSSSTG